MFTYVQPIAQHADNPERLLVRASNDRWYCWFGEQDGATLEEVDSPVAVWMQRLPCLLPVPEPRCWVHIDDLPLMVEGAAARRREGEKTG